MVGLPGRAVVAATALLGLLFCASTTPVVAGLIGQASAGELTSTATFGIIPTAMAGTAVSGPLTLTFPAETQPAPQYIEAVNVGSLQLTSATYFVAVSGGGTGSPEIVLTACSDGSWDKTTSMCSGTRTLIGSWDVATGQQKISAAITSRPASRFELRVSLSAVTALTATAYATINIAVSSTGPRDLPAPSVTNT